MLSGDGLMNTYKQIFILLTAINYYKMPNNDIVLLEIYKKNNINLFFQYKF